MRALGKCGCVWEGKCTADVILVGLARTLAKVRGALSNLNHTRALCQFNTHICSTQVCTCLLAQYFVQVCCNGQLSHTAVFCESATPDCQKESKINLYFTAT